MADELTEGLERYLEAIYHIQDEKGAARVKDIAAALDVHKSTVTSALHSLSKRRMVHYEPYEAATLTEEGHRRAIRLAARHRVLSCFLQDVLNVDAETADRNACRMEHAVDEDVLERTVCFLAFVRNRPDGKPDWLEDFRRFARERLGRRSCEEWIKQFVSTLDYTPSARRE